MKQLVFFIFALTLAGTGSCYAQKTLINSAEYVNTDGQAELVLTATGVPKYHFFTLDKPPRLVIDLGDADGKRGLSQPPSGHSLFGHLRFAPKNATDLRIVVELKHAVDDKSFKISAKNTDGNQLIVALVDKRYLAQADKTSQKTDAAEPAPLTNEVIAENLVKTTNSKAKSTGKKHFIVAIDAGHGGDDPGAHGPGGTHEKQVTLAIAKKLEALINDQAGMRAKLVRKGDYYVGLRERMKIARKAKADLFISIHADAVKDAEVRGASVYTLSRTGASNEAAHWLANSENAKEKVGGVNLDDKEDMVASVLLDLSQTATQQASLTLAEKVLKNFRSVGDLHYDEVQNAGFAVLKSPDIPSILVETAYISNPSDELNLLSPRYQNKMATAIFKGVLNYFNQANPVDANRVAKL